MRCLCFGLLSMMLAFPVNAQKYGIVWMDTLDNGSKDCSWDIAIDDHGNIYVTGWSLIEDYNAVTVKYDSLGNILWIDTLDTGDQNYGYGIDTDKNCNVYVAVYAYNGTDYDFLIVKYDSLGHILWMDTLDYGDDDYIYDIAVDSKGNIYVTGRCYIGGDWDGITVKYDSLGTIVWMDTLDTGDDNGACGITVDTQGNVYITGYFYNGLYQDYLTVKYNSFGDIVWVATLNVGSDDYGVDIAVDSRNNVYVIGNSYRGSYRDWVTIKYDSLGNIIWMDTIDNGRDDYASGIAISEQGNIYEIGGSYMGEDNDLVIIEYDSLGNIVWMDTLDTGDKDNGVAITVDNHGNIYTTGYSYIGIDFDYITIRWGKFKDAGIISMISPDTVCIGSEYIPSILVKNNSYEDSLSFDIQACIIDSSGADVYVDTQEVYGLAPEDSITVAFDSWTVPLSPGDLRVLFTILVLDMDSRNDTLSKILYVRDFIPPTLDSAIAFDGTNPIPGIDDDDYVILYFSESTNKPVIDNTNIDSVLSLSGGHSWLDEFGALGNCYWNPDGTQLLINLTTNISPPTIAVGDTITPDGKTITDLYGNACMSPIVLKGSFDPQGVSKNEKMMLYVSPISVGGIRFSYKITKDEKYTISLYGNNRNELSILL